MVNDGSCNTQLPSGYADKEVTMKQEMIVIRIDEKKKERLKEIVSKQGKTISNELNCMIDNYINNYGLYAKRNDKIKNANISRCFVHIYDELTNENIDREYLLKELGELECLY